MALKEHIQELLKQVPGLQAANAEELEALRIKYLSKKGEITALFNEFREVPNDQKRELGQLLNQLRQETEGRINCLREQFEEKKAETDRLDLTRTPDPIELGTRHPLSLVREEIEDIFSRIGFTIAQGPEVEDDKHVYGMLNFAPEHPARDMQSQKPPIRVLCPGRVYRNEAISARAHCFFHQVEGLYIDKNVSFADLREALLYFSKEMFGADTKIRLRPSYFPFTEPSAEMDISCNICGGTGCSFCKGTGWVEILGCGMVDPNVLEACGIDSKEYSGYAFGMGVERITNLKYRVKDLRLFSENDVRFLKQFESC